jgi:H+/Cl- antiporter ClcA
MIRGPVNSSLLGDHNDINQMSSPLPVLATVTVLTGVAAGLCGMLLALLLRVVQHLAYGYNIGCVRGDTSFLQGVMDSTPLRRSLVLSVCGVVAGLGWWAIRRFGSPLVSIGDAVSKGDRMPSLTTVAHDLMQIVTVGLGSSLGRETAPREIGALFASFLSRRARLTAEECRIVIACGAAAGLAAVYNVPLGGALFALEVLLGTFRLSAVIPAVTTSAIAAYVAWIGLGDETPYVLPHLSINGSLITWSVVTGPLFGLAARWFAQTAQRARARAPRDWRLPVWCAVIFPSIGFIVIFFPQILGNGKGLALLGFDGSLTVGGAAILLLLKIFATIGCLRAGAEGGLMTPSIAIGALFATLTGGLWNWIWPGSPSGALAVVGGTAFLASSMRMPLTAIALMMEFTRVDHDFLIPMAFAVVGSISASHLSGVRALSARTPSDRTVLVLEAAGERQP